MYETLTTTELARAFVGFPVLVADEKGIIIAATRPLEMEFGYPVVGSLRQKPFDIIFHENFRGKYHQWRHDYTEDARIVAIDVRCVKKDGTEFDGVMQLYNEIIQGKMLTYAIISEVAKA